MANPFRVPLNALRAVEILGRTGALGPAAEELGVTPGAVSQHIRRAEERFGVPLFLRTPKGLVPTEALSDMLPHLSQGFAALERGVSALVPDDEQILTLTVGSVFASRWLIWRISRFTSAHPDLELRLVVTGHILDLGRRDIDCAIRFGRGAWPEVSAERLGGESVSPVCAPALARRLETPANLAHVPVIRDESTMLSWADWLAAAGVPGLVLSGPSFTDPALAFDAAVSGAGVLLAADMMSADAIRDGRLVRPFEVVDETALGYWLCRKAGKRMSRKVERFRRWLLEEAADAARTARTGKEER